LIQREQIEALKARASREEQAKLVLLFNGTVSAQREYQEARSDQALRAWQRAERATDDYAGELAERYGVEFGTNVAYRTQKEVLEYLVGRGLRCSRSQLSRDVKASVDRYAERYLNDKGSGLGKAGEKLDRLQERKLVAEIELAEERAKKARLEREVSEGKYIERVDFELHMAMAAGALESGLKYFFKMKAGELVDVVAGDQGRAGELVALLHDGLDQQLAIFARPREIEVEIEGDGV
jgi:hypothetical protein